MKKSNQYFDGYELPPQVIRDFAPVRAKIMKAVAAQPKSVSFEEAKRQVNLALRGRSTEDGDCDNCRFFTNPL